jgi:hypothetical protein
MNVYDYENTAEYNRQQIHAELKQIRLAHSARHTQAYHPHRFARLMVNFANWMIATGKQLRNRYEIPVPHCNQTISSKNFAH